MKRVSCLRQSLHVFAYLNKLYPSTTDHDEGKFWRVKCNGLYSNAKEDIPMDVPLPRVNVLQKVCQYISCRRICYLQILQ